MEMLGRYFCVTEKWSKRREDKISKKFCQVERPVREHTGWISEYYMKGKK